MNDIHSAYLTKIRLDFIEIQITKVNRKNSSSVIGIALLFVMMH